MTDNDNPQLNNVNLHSTPAELQVIVERHMQEHAADFKAGHQELLVEQITAWHEAELAKAHYQGAIDELEKTHEYIEDTYMILTNDLPALLEQDRVFKIREQHKAELHKNIDERLTQLKAALKDGAKGLE